MEEKRRRARVQGAWAAPVKSQAIAQPATTAKSRLHQKPGQTWKNKEHHLSDREFVFKEPQQVVRRAPEPLVIEQGVYEISLSPTGVSRVCLYPGFVDVKEADWILEQLCQDVPWKQRTGIREDSILQLTFKKSAPVSGTVTAPQSCWYERPSPPHISGPAILTRARLWAP
ncbi:ALKBH3 isoform 3 [Pongo abelii]|uniref:ALKBH3 isoform 3 n=1 Tax=Pongo abelii TaxID=9601 RepID=A0A2J8WFM7_PONAB|nr:ALKBH3 isoform 3 [Pongo abelii]